jgi:Bax protein
LARVDTVPLSLVLAQAANESSWGQSRFAQEGNNLFGEWCFREGCGIVPEQRSAGKSHEVAAFDSVNASVRSYLHNLNTGRAYAALRKLRQQARAAGEAPKAMVLASGLARYSERGLAYVHEIKAMIRSNRELMMAPVPGG